MDPPSLDDTYSGAPVRLRREAAAAKARLQSNRTLPPVRERKRGLRLPPDVTQEKFEAAVAELRAELGAEHVAVNDAALVDGWYLEHPNTHDLFCVADAEELVSSAAVFPGSTHDVQATVRWANRHGLPLYPVSLGRNVGYGGAAPRVPGGIVVDLGRRMHAVLKMDGDNASCVVEPGVTYFALHEELRRRQLPLWIDPPDVGGGSVLGNAVDRGVGYTPYGDHFGNHCGLEVVLPSGELLRTGMGAMPGPEGTDNPTWQSFQHAFGPAVDGLFSQSSLGIVTKMGLHLMPATGHQSYCVTFPRDDDLEAVVEIIRPLAQQRVLGNVPQLRHVVQELAVTGERRARFRAGSDDSPLSRDEVRAAARNLPLGDCAWIFYGTQYGTPEAISAQLSTVREAFGAISGSRFFLPADLPPHHYLHSRAKVCAGEPVLRELDWLNWTPNGAHLFFSPIAPTRGCDARAVHEVVASAHARHGFDVLPTLCVAGREIHYIANIVYDRGDVDARRRAVCLMRDMIAACAALGFGEYRTHLLFADQVARTYSWGDQALLRFNEAIKDALDPNGVLAPGRNGIWPRKYRGRGWELGAADVDLQHIGPRADP